MNRSTVLRAMAAGAFAVIAVGASLVICSADRPKHVGIDRLPVYPYVGSTYSIDDIGRSERDRTETALRRFAASVVPGYRLAAERFLASRGDFVWDAIRSSVGGYLSTAGFGVRVAGQSELGGDDIAFIVWDRSHVRSPRTIVAVALQNPLRSAPNMHLYAYFELTELNVA